MKAVIGVLGLVVVLLGCVAVAVVAVASYVYFVTGRQRRGE